MKIDERILPGFNTALKQELLNEIVAKLMSADLFDG